MGNGDGSTLWGLGTASGRVDDLIAVELVGCRRRVGRAWQVPVCRYRKVKLRTLQTRSGQPARVKSTTMGSQSWRGRRR